MVKTTEHSASESPLGSSETGVPLLVYPHSSPLLPPYPQDQGALRKSSSEAETPMQVPSDQLTSHLLRQAHMDVKGRGVVPACEVHTHLGPSKGEVCDSRGHQRLTQPLGQPMEGQHSFLANTHRGANVYSINNDSWLVSTKERCPTPVMSTVHCCPVSQVTINTALCAQHLMSILNAPTETWPLS